MPHAWDKLADKETVEKTIAALKENGIDAEFVENGEEAKARVLELLPNGAEVMTMSSTTLSTIGLDKEINEAARLKSVRSLFEQVDEKEKRHLGAAPDWTVGSVHAATEDGHLLIASNSGSQLPAYAYGAEHVVWVVGTQKIARNIEDGTRRIYEYTLPLEDKRARKAYGVGSGVNKLLIFNLERKPDRVKLIFVNEKLGF